MLKTEKHSLKSRWNKRNKTNRIKVLIAAAAVIILVTGGIISYSLVSGNQPSESTTTANTYLYEVQAPSGSISNLSLSKSQNESFTLTLDALTGAADVVTRFADRPYREASTLTPDELTEQWSTLFASSSPNAILSYLEPGSALPQSIVVTLTKPVHDHNTGSLSFTATRIYRENATAAGVENPSRPATPSQFTSASLFIDGSSSITLTTDVPGLAIDISTTMLSARVFNVTISCGYFVNEYVLGVDVDIVNQEAMCGSPGYQLDEELALDNRGISFTGSLLDSGQIISQWQMYLPLNTSP